MNGEAREAIATLVERVAGVNDRLTRSEAQTEKDVALARSLADRALAELTLRYESEHRLLVGRVTNNDEAVRARLTALERAVWIATGAGMVAGGAAALVVKAFNL